ncbi:MAG TPA: hypothetical protein PKD73_08035 [Burkholderiaceae bacterium]|nr:hypothetical protein [Burkholderiaceae bacterium]
MQLTGPTPAQVPARWELGDLAFMTRDELAALMAAQLFVVEDRRASGVHGDTPSASSQWLTRTLNTLSAARIAGAGLGSNIVTLPPGLYLLDGWAAAYAPYSHALRLWNVTAGAVVDAVPGSGGYQPSASTTTPLGGFFELTVTSTLRLEHWVSSVSSYGFGYAAGTGRPEVYAHLTFRRLAS